MDLKHYILHSQNDLYNNSGIEQFDHTKIQCDFMFKINSILFVLMIKLFCWFFNRSECKSHKECPMSAICRYDRCRCKDELIKKGKECLPGRIDFYIIKEVVLFDTTEIKTKTLWGK